MRVLEGIALTETIVTILLHSVHPKSRKIVIILRLVFPERWRA